MLDPITLSAAVTGATTAYKAIKQAISVGKEIEDMSSELSRWMTAVSDVDNVHRNANSPSALDKIFNGSIEEVAIESFSAKKKLAKQREELKNFLVANYGTAAWDDLIREEGRIRRARQEAVYAREERNKQIRDYTIMGVASLVGVGALGWIVWIISLSF
jgi:nitrate reductase NapE component